MKLVNDYNIGFWVMSIILIGSYIVFKILKYKILPNPPDDILYMVFISWGVIMVIELILYFSISNL